MSDNKSKPSAQFEYQSVAANIVWLLLTGGLYGSWWCYKQTRVINDHSQEFKIPLPFVHFSMAMTAVFALLFMRNLQRVLSGDFTPADMSTQLAAMAFTVSLTMWMFLIRAGVNSLAKTQPNDPNWIGMGVTFALCFLTASSVYIQHKINRVLRDKGKR